MPKPSQVDHPKCPDCQEKLTISYSNFEGTYFSCKCGKSHYRFIKAAGVWNIWDDTAKMWVYLKELQESLRNIQNKATDNDLTFELQSQIQLETEYPKKKKQ